MKKLLLIIMLSTGIISCNKEQSLQTTPNSENQSITRGYPRTRNYLISNCSDVYGNGYIYPASNNDMERIWHNESEFSNSNFAWTMEYIGDGLVKFWMQKGKGWFERQRVLDVDWRHPKSDGSVNAVVYELHGGPCQRWELIGAKTANNGVIEYFRGVMVNNYTGQMLELTDNGRYAFAIARGLYKGSDEEKYYQKHGNFNNYCYGGRSTIWTIERWD
ncbi:MAG: hypothetical protein ACQPRJ_02350 [Solitalea-like symbiont of Acarus siro]